MATKEQLAKIIASRAGGLCSPEADKKFDGMAGRSSLNEMYDPDPASFDDTDDPWGMPGMSSNSEYDARPSSQKSEFVYNKNTASNSRMPEAIKASMLEQRIDTSSLSNTSVTDQLGLKIKTKPQQQKRQQIAETVMPQQTATIDYALIKSIVKECLAESNNNVLNESALKTIKLSGGKIRLIDNSGNIYTASLEKSGNINDKKK